MCRRGKSVYRFANTRETKGKRARSGDKIHEKQRVKEKVIEENKGKTKMKPRSKGKTKSERDMTAQKDLRKCINKA